MKDIESRANQLKEKLESILNSRLKYFKNHLNCKDNYFNLAIYNDLEELCRLLTEYIVEQYKYSQFRSCAKSLGISSYHGSFFKESIYEFDIWIDIKVSNRNIKKDFGVEKLQYKLIFKNVEYTTNDMKQFVELIRNIK